jgi:hypothetical protein
MENKINVAKLLKDCPSGMELDCAMYQDVYFDYVDTLNIIHCYIQHETHKSSITFNQFGTPNSDIKSKCLIFPKGKTTWEGFQRPFKDGDILVGENVVCKYIIIYKKYLSKNTLLYYASLTNDKMFSVDSCCDNKHIRFATEEEKQKLFDAIKDNGYHWNNETKTLEKLVPDKFDITTLKPFESRVLVRDTEEEKWKPSIWGYYDNNNTKYYPYETVGGNCFQLCIPYDKNEHLLSTTDDCDDFYKTWES